MPAEHRRRRPSRGLILAMLVPAVAAGAAVALADRREDRPPPVRNARSPEALARAASDPTLPIPGSLRPLRARPGVAGVGTEPLQNLDGGLRPAPPSRISIPDAHVAADVDAVHTRDGELRVPHIGRAGWYAAGPRPGEIGKSVVIGHLDTGRGPGLFADVPNVRRGAAVTVLDKRGDVHRFRVIGTAQVRKNRFPTEAVYGPARVPVLVLITCGGPFNFQTGHYRDNVLVYARAV